MKRLSAAAIVVSAQLALCTGASAALISYTSQSAFLAAAGSVSTEDFNSQTDGATFHTTPLDVGPFTLSMTGSPSTSSGRNQIDAPPPQFAAFDVDGTTVANVLTTRGDSLLLTFDSAITSFGVSLAAFNDDRIRTEIVLGGSVFQPAASAGSVVRFFGVTSDTAFTTVRFRGLDNDGFGMDNVLYGARATVPEPGSLALLGAGLLGWHLTRRRRTS